MKLFYKYIIRLTTSLGLVIYVCDKAQVEYLTKIVSFVQSKVTRWSNYYL